MIALLGMLVRGFVELYAAYCVGCLAVAAVFGLMALWHRVTAAPRTVAALDQWTTVEDYDAATGSHPRARGLAPPPPHGLGEPPLQHSPVVPLWGFAEPEQRLFEQLGIWVRDSHGNGWEVR